MRGFASIFFKNVKMCANSSHLQVLINDFIGTISLKKLLCDRRDPSHISTVMQRSI